jgi:hypothetical protein
MRIALIAAVLASFVPTSYAHTEEDGVLFSTPPYRLNVAPEAKFHFTVQAKQSWADHEGLHAGKQLEPTFHFSYNLGKSWEVGGFATWSITTSDQLILLRHVPRPLQLEGFKGPAFQPSTGRTVLFSIRHRF